MHMRQKLILSILIPVVVCASSSNSTAASGPVDRLEASVNSSLILLSDVVKFRDTLPLRQQLDPLFAGTSLAEKGVRSTDADIVQFLVDERMISQAFPVNDTEVDQEVNSILANNRIDRTVLKNTLKAQGFSFEDYFDLIRSSSSKRNLIDRDIRTKVTISEDDIKNYFSNHYSKTAAAPQAYKVKIITIDPKNYKSAAAARETAERALKQIQSGESFEEVAKGSSDDATAEAGGDLGTLSEDQMSPEIRKQLKQMQVGQVSPVLGNAATTFFILKLADITSTEDSRYDKVKEEIRNQLAASEYQRQIALWLDRQRQTAFIHLAGQPSIAGLPRTPIGPKK